MPLYLYKCNHCKRTFELLMKNSKEHPGTCPYCMNGKDLEKQLTAPGGFILKGKGFYKNGS